MQDDLGWGNTSGVAPDPSDSGGNFADFGSAGDSNQIWQGEPQSGNMQQPQQENWQDDTIPQQDTLTPEQNAFSSNKKNMGYKKVAIILAVVLAIGALVLMGLDKISVKKKSGGSSEKTVVSQDDVQTTGDAQAQAEDEGGGNSSDGTGEGTMEQQDEPVSTSSGGNAEWHEISADTVLSYTGEKLSAQGTVHDKVRYLDNNQVVYCIKIVLTVGGSNQLVNYYCGYNVFNSVNAGDVITVEYQQVSDTCFSVNTITK